MAEVVAEVGTTQERRGQVEGDGRWGGNAIG